MSYRWNLENVIETLNKLNPDAKPVWGEMSAQRMVEHLSDTLRIATGENPQPLLIPEDKIERMQAFLETEKPMSRGVIVPHAPKDAQIRNENIEIAIDEFAEVWISFEDFYQENVDRTEIHSYYGPLNYDKWRKLGDKHLNHHFEQFNLI